MVAGVLVEVANKNVDKIFDYLVPSSMESNIKVGMRVLIPFASRVILGFVLELKSSSSLELKEIIKVIDDDAVLNDELLDLGKFVQKMTLSTLISAYQTMLPKALKASSKRSINIKYVTYLKLDREKLLGVKLTNKDHEFLNLFGEKDTILKSDVKGFVYTINKLKDAGVIDLEMVEKYRLDYGSYSKKDDKPLTVDQEMAINKIINSDKMTCLLYGVTGSGKTYVYVHLIRYMLGMGKTSIVLVPEIGLTPQMIAEFKSRFTCGVAVLHSRLSDGERYDEYRRINRGEVEIVIGTRSAVFAPLKNIGIIIIDEEHTSSYKQDNNPKYNAILVAQERCRYHNAKLILGSATPSLDSYARAVKGVYELVVLPKRVNNRKLPLVNVVDMNKEIKKSGYLSSLLIDKIKKALDRNEQVMLLLNRRGYASLIACSSCGHVFKCPSCDISLTYHKNSNMLRCHYCGYAEKLLDICPSCHERAIRNLGVGTERIEEELNKIFKARIIRMDYDTTSTKGAHEKILSSYANGEYDILLGTQMIAKGLDFKNVTLVGVINADTSLLMPSYKSSEYTFELLCQVFGRSGRSDKEGEVVVQTYNKDNYAIVRAINHDYIGFFKEEMGIRRKLLYPPYVYIVLVRILSKDYDLAKRESINIKKYLDLNKKDEIILGPGLANVFKINNVYRFQIMIKYKNEDNIYDLLNKVLNHYKTVSSIKVDVDFNPNNI